MWSVMKAIYLASRFFHTFCDRRAAAWHEKRRQAMELSLVGCVCYEQHYVSLINRSNKMCGRPADGLTKRIAAPRSVVKPRDVE